MTSRAGPHYRPGMKVIKLGGGCLKDKHAVKHILGLVARQGRGHVFVVSALNGITNKLISGLDRALESEDEIPLLLDKIKATHMDVARHTLKDATDYEKILDQDLRKLERLYYGLNITREASPRMEDAISSFGECLCVALLAEILKGQGISARFAMPQDIGMVTDGKFGDATARLGQTEKNLKKNLAPLLEKDGIMLIPGFFGVGPDGDITTFGRGGTDYSAAVVATALNAEALEIWKDVEGFMSVDPRLVPDARLIPLLSYSEAAELSYFGAKILHPRTVEPVRRKKLDIAIKNTMNPKAEGSLITAKSPKTKGIIKSVAHNQDICLLKVFASGVGARIGILGIVASRLAEAGINIKSVVTSQTSISLLLSNKDMEKGYKALQDIKPRPYRKLEKLEDVSLVSIVGQGLHRNKGIAGRCFMAVAEAGVNIEMISFGPSRYALYFLVRNKDLKTAVTAIHKTFFPSFNV